MKQKPNIWITLALAALVVTALSFVLPKNAEKYLGELFWVRKTFAPAKYNVVLMGDSRVYRGLSPNIIEQHLPNLKVLNFAYSNGGLNPTMFEAAEKKLEDSDFPRVIVMGVAANTVTGYSASNQQFQQELNRPREEIWERRYLNPVRYWFSATSPEDLKTHFSNQPETSYYRNKFFMNGYVESDKFPIDTTAAIPSYTADFSNYKVEQEKLEVLFKQIKKWSGQGIIIIGFYPPVSQAMKKLEMEMGLFNEAQIKAGFESNSGYWIPLNSINYKTYDGSHLTIESAKRLSNKVGGFVAEILEE